MCARSQNKREGQRLQVSGQKALRLASREQMLRISAARLPSRQFKGAATQCKTANVRSWPPSFGGESYNSMMPRFRAIVTAWVRSFAPSLDNILSTWLLTLASAIESLSATRLLL